MIYRLFLNSSPAAEGLRSAAAIVQQEDGTIEEIALVTETDNIYKIACLHNADRMKIKRLSHAICTGHHNTHYLERTDLQEKDLVRIDIECVVKGKRFHPWRINMEVVNKENLILVDALQLEVMGNIYLCKLICKRK